MQILWVDSDEGRARRSWKLLDEIDVTMRLASDCGEAIEFLAESHVSAVVVAWNDFRQASQNGDDWTNQLRSKCKLLVCVVDRMKPPEVEEAYSAGFDDCFFTDSCPKELSTKLAKLRELEELDQRLAKAQKLESIGELAAGIAHEINTPIQYVGDNTRFVQSAYDDLADVLDQCQALMTAIEKGDNLAESADKLRAAIEAADIEYLQEEVPSAITQTLEGVDRVANIVRAMKEFAHPGASEMTATDLSKSIENTVMVARNEWKYVADLETDFDSELSPVPCLPGELNQVLLNIIVNAAHAIGDTLGESPEDKGKIRITTLLASPFAEIRISDSGSGISQENIDRIFTPFFTTKAAGKGTGQGLAIAHSVVVEKHGGTIEVESTLGEGTTFVIRLPLELRQKAASNADSDVLSPSLLATQHTYTPPTQCQ